MNNKTNSNKFIVVEGLDGSGKSTAVRTITETLEKLGYTVTKTAALGKTDIGAFIRSMLASHKFKPLHEDVQALLMTASIRNCVYDIVIPAIENGDIVVTDRYTQSTFVHQPNARDIEILMETTNNICPIDILFYMDVDVQLAMDRMKQRGVPLEDMENVDFEVMFERKDAYEEALKITKCKHLFIIDANSPVDKVKEQIRSYLRQIY